MKIKLLLLHTLIFLNSCLTEQTKVEPFNSIGCAEEFAIKDDKVYYVYVAGAGNKKTTLLSDYSFVSGRSSKVEYTYEYIIHASVEYCLIKNKVENVKVLNYRKHPTKELSVKKDILAKVYNFSQPDFHFTEKNSKPHKLTGTGVVMHTIHDKGKYYIQYDTEQFHLLTPRDVLYSCPNFDNLSRIFDLKNNVIYFTNCHHEWKHSKFKMFKWEFTKDKVTEINLDQDHIDQIAQTEIDKFKKQQGIGIRSAEVELKR